MHSSFAFAGNSEALFGRSPWGFIRRFIARVLGAFHINPLTGTNFGAYDSEATACRMSASVQSPVELPVDARLSASHMWYPGTRNDRYIGRHGISIEDRDGVLFLYHCKPRERTSLNARAEQRTTGIYIRVAARDALSGGTCYLRAMKRSGMKRNS
ncbi:hypothetical protein G5I_09538 [Acromyrmex echinatior]|uniref:Uncharacterized protein n=1 Tax=Acromyrmex echinatior TaxID=103372 RepID=F4WUG8_ACREC|nr:hypothetical protein G5I_09538 [Acromyrmex echinatior]